MRIAIYHGNFESVAGGGEVAALRAAKALKEMGHEVDLYTNKVKLDVMRQVCENAGVCILPKLMDIDADRWLYRVFSTLSSKHILSSIWLISSFRKLLTPLGLEMSRLSKEYDVVISKQSPPITLFIDVVLGDVTYFHYPTTLIGFPLSLNKYIPDSIMPFVRLYKKLIIDMELRTLAENTCRYASMARKVLTNSTWTRINLLKANTVLLQVIPEPCRPNIIELLQGVGVVYPPVDYETYFSMYDPRIKKGIVLTVSRYSPGKNLWSVVYVASKLPEAHFIIAGTTKEIRSSEVIAQLELLIDKLRLKNVSLEKDVPKKRLAELYEEAKIYLHPLYTEHFGIAIAEGAAAGAVPVVYKDGGGWLDVASRIDQSLGYTNIGEAAAIVRSLLGNEDLWLRLSRRSVEVARDFSWGSYKRRLDAAVREAYEMKKRRSPHS